MCQLVLPAMRAQRWGKIVNVSSMGGRFTFPGAGHYHASKYAVEAISDALRFEVRGFGIDVIVVEPGIILTGFGEHARPGAPGDGPYAEFDAAVGTAYVETYEKGLLRRLGGPPEAVAKRIAKAITAHRPRARYTVTASAKALIAQKAAPARRRLGRGHADDVPPARAGLIHRSRRGATVRPRPPAAVGTSTVARDAPCPCPARPGRARRESGRGAAART